MGHHISAIVCKPSAGVERVSEYDLPIIRSGEFVIVPMDANHSDYWAEQLGLGFSGSHSEVIIDGSFAHHVAAMIAEGDYALIETDYFGGAGEQIAAVYSKGQDLPIFASDRVTQGAINEALKAIGVRAQADADEFDTLGLGTYRNFDEYFKPYHD